MRALEPIYAALFAVAQSAKSDAIPFTTMSRRWIAWDQMASEQSPALFQRQPPLDVQGGARGLPKFELKAEWYIYLATDPSDLSTVTATALNNYVTALISALQGSIPGQQQTLGGLVQNAYVDGQIVLDEGLISSPAVALIPITILTGF